MKTFKSFLQLDELTGVSPKAKGEHKFVHSTYLNQIKDPGDLEKVGPEEIGPHDTKMAAGKRKLDRLDNKQKFGESVDIEEADFSKSQTKMAHAIGKHFKKKGIGDESKGGPYAVASAMVRDKPEAAKKAYATIKAKMKNEDHQDMLMALYDELSEENQQAFEAMLDSAPERLLSFAQSHFAGE